MKLQNNKEGYTTTEQAKVLLKLGLQADSADCYYNPDGENIGVLPDNTTFSEFKKSIKRVLGKDLHPCWSIGRLMKIFELCTSSKFERIKTKCPVLEDILWQIEICVTETQKGFRIDFSKLED